MGIKTIIINKNNQGFTLLEVLIALFIISMISMMAYQSIDNMIKVEQQLESTDKMLNSIHKTFIQWQADCKMIEKQSMYKLDENIGLIRKNTQNSGVVDILWLIRRNVKINNINTTNNAIKNLKSEWQLVAYMHYQKKWMRMAFKATTSIEDLLQSIQKIRNTDNYTAFANESVHLLPSDVFALNIWQDQAWQPYIKNIANNNNNTVIEQSSLSSTRALQLSFALPAAWHSRLGAEHHMNCMLKM